jgi:hypothetical protein
MPYAPQLPVAYGPEQWPLTAALTAATKGRRPKRLVVRMVNKVKDITTVWKMRDQAADSQKEEKGP